jgi:hypothetical protein
MLIRMEKKIDLIIRSLGKGRSTQGAEEVKGAGVLDIMTLLSLPDHLRRTALTLIKLGRAMAEDVAKETGRARAIESAYLNQLVRMEYARRERVGKRVYFTVEENVGGRRRGS